MDLNVRSVMRQGETLTYLEKSIIEHSGKLKYLTLTRLDIYFAVSMISQFLEIHTIILGRNYENSMIYEECSKKRSLVLGWRPSLAYELIHAY